jgi:[acyl-carrier-protein] S-malonyltransferase
MTDTAFVFPGQGSQSVGMLSEACAVWPQVADTFAEASDVLGFDLWRMASEGPAETLALTANTQPLILTASVALYRAFLAAGGSAPAVAAGHSLGEFSALVAAQSLNFSDAVMLVRRRGEAMQEAVPVGVGAMAAIIGLDDESINDVCRAVSRDGDHIVLAVNYNSPGQVVIAGHAAAVDDAVTALKQAGAKRAMPLPVSAPFHTPLMHYAGEVLAEALSTIKVSDPLIPVISNIDAQPQRASDDIRARLVKQVSAPVLWTGCVASMIEMGCTQFVECGPGKVLSGLIRRIDKSKPAFCIETPDDMQTTLTQLG